LDKILTHFLPTCCQSYPVRFWT